MKNKARPTPEDSLDSPFEALVRAHYPRLFGIAFTYLRDADAAEDAVQEALLRSWRQGGVQDLTDPVAYLFRAVRNQCVTTLRHRRRWRSVELDDDQPIQPTLSPAGEFEAEEMETAVRHAIGELPERCRLIFLLSREQHMSYAEIARSLDLSVKTVEAQMGKALRLLRARLARFLVLALTSVDLFGR
jgi:RNA polymerase sigma-70 factor, ECF subfamily